ncbi:hypothetical protein ACHAW6_001933 [Cyclotella cf. meneghiniana]
MAGKSPDESTWTCRAYTFSNCNKDSNKRDACTMCGTSCRSLRTSNPFLRESMCLADAFRCDTSSSSQPEIISKLCNMLFAAWESNHQSWVYKRCTFENGPRYLMCGECGMAEGATGVEGDDIIASGLGGMSLGAAQKYLFDAVHKELNDVREEKLQQERVAELFDEEIKSEVSERCTLSSEDTEYLEENDNIEKLRKQIETLEKLQDAELAEHDNMVYAIEIWCNKLKTKPDKREEQQLFQHKEMLEKSVKEWMERTQEI